MTVVNSMGTSRPVSADVFTWYNAPAITAISPSTGPPSGGTLVTVTGFNFGATSAVMFGSSPAQNFTVNSSTQITAVSPTGTAMHNISVTNPGGTSPAVTADQFTWYATALIAAINPSGGPLAGGTTVTVSGSGFTGVTAVYFGSTRAPSFTFNNDGNLTAVAPAGSSYHDVTVVNSLGTSPTGSADVFTWYSTPAISAISPSAGPPTGGTLVTVTGFNFGATSAVMFGSTPASSFTVNSSTQITATSPAGSSYHNISVTNPGGTSPAVTADQFTWYATATITAISPSSGPLAGGTTVTVSGSGFTGVTAVYFGSTRAPSFTFNNDGNLTAVAPAGSGSHDVTIVNSIGTSPTSSADLFSWYTAPAITGISPSSGPSAGGTTVTITGTNFTGATSVQFASTTIRTFTINSATQITVVSPAGSSYHNISVTNPGGTSPAVHAGLVYLGLTFGARTRRVTPIFDRSAPLDR